MLDEIIAIQLQVVSGEIIDIEVHNKIDGLLCPASSGHIAEKSRINKPFEDIFFPFSSGDEHFLYLNRTSCPELVEIHAAGQTFCIEDNRMLAGV